MKHICVKCGDEVDHLEVFPGPRCLTCWTAIGNRQAQTMTAEDLAAMWSPM
jgi:DNA-directed RNA polymerase subunit RPC12/RpoP